MRFIFFFVFVFAFGVCLKAQETGIRFDSTLSWSAIQAKAKTENKYIFVDCYTTWCGPCKYMSKFIFSQKTVGDFFNSHFINVAVQMDQTQKDSPVIRNWYKDAENLSKEYDIHSYPTYLFFTPEGLIVHRAVGSTENANEFIGRGNEALNPSRQYYTLIEQWPQYKRDTVFLDNLLKMSLALSDNARAVRIGNDYLHAVHNLWATDKLFLMRRLMVMSSSIDSTWFNFFVNNASDIDRITNDAHFVERVVSKAIFDEEITPLIVKEEKPIRWEDISNHLKKEYPQLDKVFMDIIENLLEGDIAFEIRLASKKDSSANWKEIENVIAAKFPGSPWKRILFQEKADYYAGRKQWGECGKASYLLLKQYGNEISDEDLNNIAWEYIFLHSSSQKILREASKWMRNSIIRSPESIQYISIDTYANILFKTGQQKKAIFWEQKAIERAEKNKANPNEILGFKRTLEKINKEEPTWIEGI